MQNSVQKEVMCSSRKCPYSLTEGIGNSWGLGGSQRPKNVSNYMKFEWNFQRGGGEGLRKKPFREGGMDNFWNHTIHSFKNHILVTWPATNFKIWPTNRFLKAKSYNFHFHKNDVTWPLSAWPIHFLHRECINLQKGSLSNKMYLNSTFKRCFFVLKDFDQS